MCFYHVCFMFHATLLGISPRYPTTECGCWTSTLSPALCGQRLTRSTESRLSGARCWCTVASKVSTATSLPCTNIQIPQSDESCPRGHSRMIVVVNLTETRLQRIPRECPPRRVREPPFLRSDTLVRIVCLHTHATIDAIFSYVQ